MTDYIPDEFFIDREGWVVVPDPQHGMSCRLRVATEEDERVYEERLKQKD